MTETTLLLNGEWEYLPDRSQAYNAAALPADGWQTMDIPLNWQLAGLESYTGVVWFRRSFTWDAPPPAYPVFVRFQGVDYLADVWVNGHALGHHEGYFQPFEFDVRFAMKTGTNELLVRVDAPYEEPGPQGWPNRKRLIKGIFNHHDCRPGSSNPEHGQDMCTGGIWNDVALIACSAARIERLQIAPALLKKGAAVTITLHVQNYASQPVEARVAVTVSPYNFAASDQEFTLSTTRTLQPGANRVILARTIANPRLWSTWDYGSPNLYTCRASVTVAGEEVSRAEDRFGIRELTATGDWVFRLNGQRVFLRGTNIIPTQWLSEYSAEMIRKDIALLRECNVNAVRVHAHVEREEFYRACDEAGILVWADFALQWSYDDADEFKANAVSQIRDFVRLLYNRPSIGVWCCHNEPTFNHFTLDPLLAQAAREEDGTRIVTPSSDFKQHTYPGWYTGHWRDYAELPAAPFINEYGAQALPNLETLQTMFDAEALWPTTPEHWKQWAIRDFQYDQTFNVAQIDKGNCVEEFIANSQRYQAHLVKYATELYRLNKWTRVNSLFQFMFVECWPSITWAVVDYYRRPKPGYDALKTAYQPVLVAFTASSAGRSRLELGDLSWGMMSITAVKIVNDLHRDFPDAALKLSLTTSKNETFDLADLPVDIPADSVCEPLNLFDTLTEGLEGVAGTLDPAAAALAQVEPGVAQVTARLYSAEGDLLSENQAEFEFVPPMVPAPPPF
jgi:beta-mannosidase